MKYYLLYICLESSVVENLTSDAGLPGLIPCPVIYFHLYLFIPPIPTTHTTNTSSPCQDLLNTNAWTEKATAPNVVGMGARNKYKEIQMKVYGWTGIRTRIAQIVGHLTYDAGVPGSIFGPAVYFHLYFFLPSLLHYNPFSVTNGPISSRFGTNQPGMKGTQILLNLK